MKLREIVFLLLGGLLIFQLVLLYFENRSLQNIMHGHRKTRTRRTLGGQTYDSSNKYSIHRFHKSEGFGLNSIIPKDVTLVSHCTVDRLQYVIDLVKSWDGPISISIFAPGNDAAFANDAIDGLRLCWPVLREWASFHIVYPRTSSLKANMTEIGSFAYLSCKDIIRRMKMRKPFDHAMHQNTKPEDNYDFQYPHNLMRNVALSGVVTDFLMSVDIEMIPSTNLRKDFIKLANGKDMFRKEGFGIENKKMNTIFVVPAFELKQDKDVPRVRYDIVKAEKESGVRPLLQETCVECHKSTNYEQWLLQAGIDGKLDVAYDAVFSPGWEPYFIAGRDAPWFDEKMTKFGHDRLSQICELQSKEYKFSVLSDGFLIKKGFRYQKMMTRTEQLRNTNRAKFRELFRINLRQSAKIQSKAVREC